MHYRIQDAMKRAPELASRLLDPRMVTQWTPRLSYDEGEVSHWFGHAYLEVLAHGAHTELFHVGVVTTGAAPGGAADVLCIHGVDLAEVVRLAGSLEELKEQLNPCLWTLPTRGPLPACRFTQGDVAIRAQGWDHQILAWDEQRMLVWRQQGKRDERRAADQLTIEARWQAELPNIETQLHRWTPALLAELREEQRHHAAYVLEGAIAAMTRNRRLWDI